MSDVLTVHNGHCVEVLKPMQAESVNCCVTSPPYWGLRRYKTEPQLWGDGWKGELGLEPTPDQYIAHLCEVFYEVKRVLRGDGTLWLNIGDSFYGGNKGNSGVIKEGDKQAINKGSWDTRRRDGGTLSPTRNGGCHYLKDKDLVGIPWMVAFALRAAGWWLRCDVVWSKPNAMPESVTDRPTRAHEYLFLLSKSESYYYDHEAIKKQPSPELLKQVAEGYNGNATKDFFGAGVQDASSVKARIIDGCRKRIEKQRGHFRQHAGFNHWDNLTKEEQMACGSNKRSVWTVATANYKGNHFATFPPDLIKPCVLAGCPAGGVVLDPFGGSGTTGEVAVGLGRRAVLIELNKDNAQQCRERGDVTAGLGL